MRCPVGGIKMVEGSCKAYNRELDPMIKKSSPNTVRPTTGAYSTFIPDILRCPSGVLTGLPDAYGPWSYHR
ncbi:hypothetical protein KCP70_21120 [Salmonella enterica subsp. enterica]|nr:hypothetical protein KCP70_21120 [Salmonella enterica subsp. enterica]